MENLDPLIREAWEQEIQDAVFVHYLDGGYNSSVALNIHVIADDLDSEQRLSLPLNVTHQVGRDLLWNLWGDGDC